VSEPPARDDGPDLQGLPDWVKSLGLPPEAADAIDRYWKPVWDSLADELALLPEHARRAPVEAPAPGAERIVFEAVEELAPGEKWRSRFHDMWPAYRAWYLREGDAARPAYGEAGGMLRRHMPELVPTWERLVDLAGRGDLAARLLSLYRPRFEESEHVEVFVDAAQAAA
jgi:hypothetical protein